ncbi:protein of unknown function [uncultured Mediterranean phage uvMED]|nr:protein of unknown function [uncultured Mediterranean phage uvMED]BAR17555.1 protein of unknown function [uncultured Mediterranean phage uvMED]
MATTRIHQANFSGGEVDPNLISRNDLNAYGKSLDKARNVICRNQGAIERRGGTFWRADLGAESRLEPFIFSGEQEYIFAFQNTALKIYSTNGTLLQTITSCPWTTAQLKNLNLSQQADTMIVVNENFIPSVIKRTGATTFTRTDFAFESSLNGKIIYQPYFKFADNTVTLDANSSSAGSGVTVTSSATYFTNDYVGTTLKIYGTEATVTGYTSGTQVTVTLKDDLFVELDDDPFATQQGSGTVKVTHANHGLSTGASVVISGSEDIFDDDGNGLATANLNGTFTITVVDDNHYTYTAGSSDTATESVDGGGVRVVIKTHAPTRDWQEQVISTANGFPKTVAFHEQRLFFAGVPSLPDGIQGSNVGQFFKFDVGQAADSDSIQIQIASDEINEIRHIISGKVLEILTNTAEFFLKPQIGKPLTPTDLQIIRQSSLGCQLPARAKIFDGSTIFIQTNGKTVREYTFNASTEEFVSAPISLLSSHLVSTPIDADRIKSLADRDEQLYFLVNTDGTLGVYSSQKIQELQGWVQWSTTGTIQSVACSTDFVYVAVKRTINSADVYYLEQFASTSFDVPTDMTVSKTLSGSYQPHGSPLTNGSFSSVTTFIADGFTNAPNIGESFQFAGTGTVYTINSVTATANSGEYVIVLDQSVSQSDGVALQFTTSRTFSGLNSNPDMRGLEVHGTSGSTESGNINYYGKATVTSGGVVILDTPASAVDIGTDFTMQIKTLPLNAKVTATGTQNPLTGNPTKIAKCILELSSTYNLTVNSNDVLINETTIDTSSTISSYTGKKNVYFLGYNNEPSIDITQSVPLPLRILGITSEVYF